MRKGILIKITGNGKSSLRTNEMECEFEHIPQVGKSFACFGKALTEGASFRMIETSPVVWVDIPNDEVIEFNTANSTYRLVTS